MKRQPETLWIATVETRHFTFEGAGATSLDARMAVREAMYKHGRQYLLPDDWQDEFCADGIQVREYVAGECYRDREKL